MQDDHTQHSERPNAYIGDAARDAMWRGHGGFEIAMSPLILGFLGYLADGRFGTTPLFIIVGAVLGLVGSVANQYYRYQARMDALAAERASAQPAPTGRRFGRVEPVEPTEADALENLEVSA